MTVTFLAALVLSAIGLPHVLRLDRADPVAAVALWLSSLALRALSAIFIALWLVMFLPATALFDALTHWCWHTVLPLIATHLGFSGHNLADAATIAPSFVLAASAISVGFGAARAARTVRQLLRRGSIGAGPRGSVIVGGHEVLVAAAGLHRPKLVVSPGALMLLDDDELAAGLEHECGHIQRRHRFILLFAELCRALGRFLPGTRRAMSELTFHLERDADAWALARRHDRYALASAICKTALSHGHGPAFASLAGGGSRLTDRVEAMVDESSTAEIGHPSRRLRCAAGASMLLTLMLVTALPVTVANGKARLNSTDSVHHCPH